jgi:hypothetical protein
VQQSFGAVAATAFLAQLVDVSPPGYAIPIQWTAVAGANSGSLR